VAASNVQINLSWTDTATNETGFKIEQSLNGTSFTQALAMCTAMKAAGVTVFTVGFQIGSEAGAEDFMRACATSDWHFYNADDDGALKQAFRAIAINISRLRLSR